MSTFPVPAVERGGKTEGPMPMCRRTFFLGSLTAAASARVMGANSRLGIAIVGPGAMGTGHLRTLPARHRR